MQNLGEPFRLIGPSAIMLAASIGGGEWLAGPAIAVKYGPTILGFAAVSIAIQLLFNLEAIRDTLVHRRADPGGCDAAAYEFQPGTTGA